MSYVPKQKDNSYPIVAVTEEEFTSERHILPIADKPIQAGEFVGFFNGGNHEPDKAWALKDEDSLWIFEFVGIARDEYEIGDAVKVYIEQGSENPVNAFWIRLKEGLYYNRQEIAYKLLDLIEQDVRQGDLRITSNAIKYLEENYLSVISESDDNA